MGKNLKVTKVTKFIHEQEWLDRETRDALAASVEELALNSKKRALLGYCAIAVAAVGLVLFLTHCAN